MRYSTGVRTETGQDVQSSFAGNSRLSSRCECSAFVDGLTKVETLLLVSIGRRTAKDFRIRDPASARARTRKGKGAADVDGLVSKCRLWKHRLAHQTGSRLQSHFCVTMLVGINTSCSKDDTWGYHMSDHEILKTIHGILSSLIDKFKIERALYLVFTTIAYIVVMVVLYNSVFLGQVGWPEVSGFVGSTGAVTLSASRISRHLDKCMEIIQEIAKAIVTRA